MFAEEIKELMEKIKIKKNELERVGRQYIQLKNEIEKVEVKVEKLKELTDPEKVVLGTPNYEQKPINTEEGDVKKDKAIEIVNRKITKSLNSRDVIFSNRNKSTGQWWFEPNPKKFKKTLHLLLNDKEKNKLYLFKIPEDNYLDPEDIFYYREDKGACSIRIDGRDTHKFRDTLGSGVCFSEFLEDVIDY